MLEDISEDFWKRISIKPEQHDWYFISFFRNLPEDFIIEFQDYVIWDDISAQQKLSKEFIVKFSNRINFNWLLKNKNISNEVKEFCRMFL